ncbi:MAG: PBSX family phage terminase large subunit [Firmicutes bacterium]|nr:PBSX family phage terminase large subunit [Bacillota bacterium]
MKTQTLKPIFGQKHREYISRAVRATISVAEGAVRAGKTVDNVAAFAYLIDRGTPDRIHLATGSTAANAKLNIGDCNGMGLEYIFRGRCRWTKYKGNEALAIRSHGREYVVIFAGGAKADSFKKIRGNSYGMWIATEINLHHQDTIKEAFNRQLAAKVRRVFWDLNPSAPGAWIYEDYIERFREQFGRRYNYEHFTIRDNATISEQRFAEIEEQYRQYGVTSAWYRRDILGERCIAEGLIYPMFGEFNIVDEVPERGEYYISCDYGTLNPFSAGLWCWDGKKATRIREYYYSGRNERSNKTDEEYYTELERLAGDLPVKSVIVDPSAASFIEVIRRHKRFRVQKAVNDVIPGIATTARYIQDGTIKVCRSCKDAIREFGLYRWDEKSTEDKPIKENDHAMDDIRYFTMTILRHKVRKAGQPQYIPLWER